MIKQYLAHCHAEQNHQEKDIGNKLLDPDERVDTGCEGNVLKESRLGGLLNSYYRDAA